MGRWISGFIVPESYDLYGTEARIDEDGNRIVTIQTESDKDYKLPIGCYSINVIVNKKQKPRERGFRWGA